MPEQHQDIVDIDNNGKLSKVEQTITEDRFKNRRRMAWVSMLSMVALTVILVSPIVTDQRIKSLENILDMVYLAMASIVGAYMGFATWAGKK